MKTKKDFLLNESNMRHTHYAKAHIGLAARFLRSKTIAYFLLCVLAVVAISCSDDNKEGSAHDPNKPIVLTSFYPDSGRIAEMILLDGQNFGTDRSQIKVLFNTKEATIINSTGTRILALVPRLPGDTCTVTVEIGDQKKDYADFFRYKIEASVTTIAGNGTDAAVYDQGLDKSQIRPVYIGIDKDFNIFVTDTRDNLVRINVADNSITVVATGEQGFNHRCAPYANPETNILQMGAEGDGNRDRFLFCDPKE